MAKLGPPAILSIIVILLGVFFFLGAVSGWFFAKPTPMDDVGMWSVVFVLLALGGFGLWATTAEKKGQA